MSRVDPADVPDDHPAKLADGELAPEPPNATVRERLGDLLAGDFPPGWVAAFYELHLCRREGHYADGNVWLVYEPTNNEPVEVLNCDAIPTASALRTRLREFRDHEGV